MLVPALPETFEFIKDEYPNNIRRIRKHKGLSLQKLADILNTSRSQLDKLERGDRRLTVDWLERISLALECSPIDLFPEHLKKLCFHMRTQAFDAGVSIQTNEYKMTLSINMPAKYQLIEIKN